MKYGRLVLTLLFGLYIYSCLSDQNFGHFIDNIDLIFHEAGHVVFAIFGTFMHILGGSLMQCLIPAICAGYFVLRQEWFAVSFLSMWMGYNIVNVSVYMGDAVVMRLPLLGCGYDCDSGMHDWHNLLSMTGTLKYTDVFAHITYAIGMTVTATAFLAALYFAAQKNASPVEADEAL